MPAGPGLSFGLQILDADTGKPDADMESNLGAGLLPPFRDEIVELGRIHER